MGRPARRARQAAGPRGAPGHGALLFWQSATWNMMSHTPLLLAMLLTLPACSSRWLRCWPSLQGPDIEVVPPADDRLRFVIDTTAAYVLRDGPDFEQVRLTGFPAASSTQLLLVASITTACASRADLSNNPRYWNEGAHGAGERKTRVRLHVQPAIAGAHVLPLAAILPRARYAHSQLS